MSKVVPRDWPETQDITYQQLKQLHPDTKGIFTQEFILKSIQVVTPNSQGYNDFFFEDGTLYYAQSNSDLVGNNALLKAFESKTLFPAYIGFKSFLDWKGNIKHLEIYEELEKLKLLKYAGTCKKLSNLFIEDIKDNYFLIKHVSKWETIELY